MEEKPSLITLNIFLDASIFIGGNYNYENEVFRSLGHLTITGSVRVFVTDISMREVRAHIAEDVKRAMDAQDTFQRKARVFRNVEGDPYEGFFQEINEEEVCNILNTQLDDYLDEISAVELPSTNVSIAEVFDKYFNKSPPFGDGKKKAEFPDAFSMAALEDWCAETYPCKAG